MDKKRRHKSGKSLKEMEHLLAPRVVNVFIDAFTAGERKFLTQGVRGPLSIVHFTLNRRKADVIVASDATRFFVSGHPDKMKYYFLATDDPVFIDNIPANIFIFKRKQFVGDPASRNFPEVSNYTIFVSEQLKRREK
jgi:hypothetical protein